MWFLVPCQSRLLSVTSEIEIPIFNIPLELSKRFDILRSLNISTKLRRPIPMNDIILMQIIDPLKDLFKQTLDCLQFHLIYGLLLSDRVYLTRTLSSKFARSCAQNDDSLILSQGKNEEDINLLAIFHHQNRWVINISPNRHLNYIDDIRMLKGTQEGDFSDCCDGRAIAFFRSIDSDCL